MECPVCKTDCGEEEVCPLCGFTKVSKEYDRSWAEDDYWKEVDPHRRDWMKEQFETKDLGA